MVTADSWWERILHFGAYWGFEHRGFSGWGGTSASFGLGLDFGIGRDHCFLHIHLLNRSIDLQWESGFWD